MAYRTRSDASIGARTWWGQRWLDAVEPAFPTRTSRFERGDVDARTGQLSGLTVLPGRLAARAQGDRATAHSPEIQLPVFDEGAWRTITERLAATLRPAVELLHGRMPADVEEHVAAAGARVFPDVDDVAHRCTCGATGGPCRHVAALHHAFARAADDDPALLFAVRGRSPGRLRAELRAVRAGTDQVVVDDVETVEASELPIEGFDDLHGDLDEVRVHPQLAEQPAALLARLGAPPRTEDPTALDELVAAAASTAWRLAAGEGADTADDELLLAELRAKRTATAGAIADALGWDGERTLAGLQKLYEAGAVMRTGKGLDARYRAS